MLSDQLEMVEQELRDARRDLRTSQRAESDGRVANRDELMSTLRRQTIRIRQLESQAFELKDLLDAEGGE